MPELATWKRFARVRHGRFVLRVQDAFKQWPFADVLLFTSQGRVDGIDQGAGNEYEYYLRLTTNDSVMTLGANGNTLLELYHPDRSEIVMTISERNLYIFEHLGLYEGAQVQCDDEREVGDGTIIPADSTGILAQIEPSGACVVHWTNFGTEWDVDPNGLEPIDAPFDPPAVKIVTQADEDTEVLRAALAILLRGVSFNAFGAHIHVNPPVTTTIRIAEADEVPALRAARELLERPEHKG